MWVEGNNCGHGADHARALDDRAHDQLMAQMQAIKHSEG
jgi:hypothetical protein